jgi:GNAT superfamily N-acetyltransferase
VDDSQLLLRFEPLTRDYDRAAFSCGIEPLDRYLREQARQDATKRAAAPFVLLTPENRIVGYYTLSAASIVVTDLTPEIVKKYKWPRYPELPATLIGRLALDLAFHRRGLGEMLLMDALKRVWSHTEIASLAVLADAKNEAAYQFYLKNGFIAFLDRPNRLFLPMKTIEQLFSG